MAKIFQLLLARALKATKFMLLHRHLTFTMPPEFITSKFITAGEIIKLTGEVLLATWQTHSHVRYLHNAGLEEKDKI